MWQASGELTFEGEDTDAELRQLWHSDAAGSKWTSDLDALLLRATVKYGYNEARQIVEGELQLALVLYEHFSVQPIRARAVRANILYCLSINFYDAGVAKFVSIAAGGRDTAHAD